MRLRGRQRQFPFCDRLKQPSTKSISALRLLQDSARPSWLLLPQVLHEGKTKLTRTHPNPPATAATAALLQTSGSCICFKKSWRARPSWPRAVFSLQVGGQMALVVAVIVTSAVAMAVAMVADNIYCGPFCFLPTTFYTRTWHCSSQRSYVKPSAPPSFCTRTLSVQTPHK